MEKRNYGTYIAAGVVLAAVCLFVIKFDLLIAGLALVLQAAAPLFVGCVIAYVLDILLKRIEKLYFPGSRNGAVLKTRRPVCILLSFVVLLAIVFLIVNLVVPELVSSIRLITKEIPPTFELLRSWAIAQSASMPAVREPLMNANINWQEMIKGAVDFLVTGAGGIFNSVISVLTGVFGVAAKVLIGTIFAIYLLSAKEILKEQADRVMRAFLKPGTRKKVLYVLGTLHDTFSSFIVGQCMEAVIIGTLCAAGMMALRMPYSVMTGAVVGATALIPVVGAYIGAVVGAFMVFTVNPLQAVGFVVFLMILQQLEGNLIYPRVVGSSIGLPGMWVLAAVTVGGSVFGIGGMLIGVPLAASVYKLGGDMVAARLKGPKQPEQEEQQVCGTAEKETKD